MRNGDPGGTTQGVMKTWRKMKRWKKTRPVTWKWSWVRGLYIVGPGHVTDREVRVVSKQKYTLCHSRYT
jgi:hypothetical protein